MKGLLESSSPSTLAGLALAFSLVVAPAAAHPGSGQGKGPDGPLRYARIAVDDARILNLADKKGVALTEPEKGTLVAVYEERAPDWLLVEVPGGFAVWVAGRYLAPTDEADVCEVTRNAVNIRPRPSSDVAYFPLPQRLHAGDRLRVIELLESDKPMEETWVRVWSPPGVRAWLQGAATEPLVAGTDGQALWAEALRAAPVPPPLERRRSEREAAARAAVDQVQADLDRARALLASERKKETPDFGTVRAAFEAVLTKAGRGPVAIEAQHELQLLAGLEEAAALKADLERERLRRTEEALQRQREVWESSRSKDPLGGVFASRGVLEQNVGTDGVPRYQIRFGGKVVSELFCTSGRYDLELFSGYEVGVQGTRLPASAAEAVDAKPLAIEVARIEILARR